MQDQSNETRMCPRCGGRKSAEAFPSNWRKRWCKGCYAADTTARNRRRGMPERKLAEIAADGSRRCSRCREFKPIEQFQRKRRGSSAKHPYCKPCIAARTNAYRAANPERSRAAVRAAWESNGEQYRVGRARWVAANKAKILGYRRNRRARKMAADAERFSVDDWLRLQELFGFRCAYCWVRPQTLEQDHVQPLSRGGAHALANIVPSCRSCNGRKHNKTLLMFLLVSSARR